MSHGQAGRPTPQVRAFTTTRVQHGQLLKQSAKVASGEPTLRVGFHQDPARQVRRRVWVVTLIDAIDRAEGGLVGDGSEKRRQVGRRCAGVEEPRAGGKPPDDLLGSERIDVPGPDLPKEEEAGLLGRVLTQLGRSPAGRVRCAKVGRSSSQLIHAGHSAALSEAVDGNVAMRTRMSHGLCGRCVDSRRSEGNVVVVLPARRRYHGEGTRRLPRRVTAPRAEAFDPERRPAPPVESSFRWSCW